jgi:FAD/FMN-containing dehydrogenase
MSINNPDFLQRLNDLVGVIEDPARGPGPIARPRSTEDVSAIMKLCTEFKCPVVTIGGNTGLVMGTKRDGSELALSMELMSEIEEVDENSRTMTVQAGAILQRVQETAEKHGFLYPLDLGGRGSATIGGNISTNAGGNRVIRYGMTRDQIIALEMVLADGTVIPMQGKSIKNNTGYDLKHLAIGGEGTIGVVTRAILRMRTFPISQNCAWVGVEDWACLTKLLHFMDTESSGTLSSFEVMWKSYYEAMTGDTTPYAPPVPHEYPFYVLIEFQGGNQERDQARFEEIMIEAYEKGLVADAAIAQSEGERKTMWDIRDDVSQLFENGFIDNKQLSFYSSDVSLAISDMDEFVKEISEELPGADTGSHLFVFGHLGDGNLHVNPCGQGPDVPSPKELGEIIYRAVRKRGGSISAEHGIGLKRKEYLNWTRSDTEIELMRQVKRVFDPDNLMNPGKIF